MRVAAVLEALRERAPADFWSAADHLATRAGLLLQGPIEVALRHFPVDAAAVLARAESPEIQVLVRRHVAQLRACGVPPARHSRLTSGGFSRDSTGLDPVRRPCRALTDIAPPWPPPLHPFSTGNLPYETDVFRPSAARGRFSDTSQSFFASSGSRASARGFATLQSAQYSPEIPAAAGLAVTYTSVAAPRDRLEHEPAHSPNTVRATTFM